MQDCSTKALVAAGVTFNGVNDGMLDCIIVYLICQWLNKTMPTSCAPGDLANSAKTFQGLGVEQKQWIDTYLLAVIAGGSTDPGTLAKAAGCFQCVPTDMIPRIQAYLLCQIVNK